MPLSRWGYPSSPYLNHSAHSTEFQTAQWMKWMVPALKLFLSRGEAMGFSQVHVFLEHQESSMSPVSLWSHQRKVDLLFIPKGEWELKTAQGGLSLPGSVGKSWVGCCWAVLSTCWAERGRQDTALGSSLLCVYQHHLSSCLWTGC